jgi:hypothetical protein
LFEDLLKLNRLGFTLIPLRKRDDIDHELEWQTKELANLGHQVVHIARTKIGETVMVYRLIFGDGHDDEIIMLRARIISGNGIKVYDPRMHLHYHAEDHHLFIADIQIEGEDVNRGYGTVFMESLFTLLNQMEETVKYVSGWISSVDWDHIDRSVHFYQKHGFICSIDHDRKSGDLVWVNSKTDGNIEEFRLLDRGIFG